MWVVLGSVLALVLLLVWAATSLLNAMSSFSPSHQSEVTVMRIDLAPRVSLAGSIAPTHRLDLSFTSEGEVTNVAVTVGDPVARGAALASIDNTHLRAAVSDASAETDAARQDYNAARRTGPAGAVTAARSALSVKEQALKDARAALEKATLVSTIDGVVAAVNVKVGDTVGAGGGSGLPGSGLGAPGETSADVVVISRTFQVDATVGSAERAQVAKGMKATIIASSAKAPLTGSVTSVGVIAAAASGDRPTAATFPVTVSIDGEPANVFTGGAATIELVGEGRTGVLAIPRAAVMDWGNGTDATVLARVGGGEPTPIKVTLGMTQDDLVEVVSGLSEGDLVTVTADMSGGGPGGFVSSGSSMPAEEKPR